MIIDAHVHIYDILCGYGPRGEFRPLGNGRGIWANGDVEQFFPAEYGDIGFLAETLLSLMDEAGIDHAVLLQGSNYGFHNHYAFETAKAHPNRFTATVTVDPYAAQTSSIMDHFIEQYDAHVLKFELSHSWGLRGYHPELMPDSAILHPLMDKANSRTMTVVMDPGPSKEMEQEVSALLRLRERYPEITFVLAHCLFPKADGKNELRLSLLEKLAKSGWLFDISNFFCLWHIDPAGTDALNYLEGVKQAVGADNMIWGTDVPGVLKQYTYRDLISAITKCGRFTEDELSAIMCDNAAKAYKLHL